MSCDCKGCQKGRRIGTLRALQSDIAHISVPSKYPSKSKKVYMDRYLAARNGLMREVERYITGWKRGYKDSWFYSKIKRDGWYVGKYRKARAEAKKRGLL